ncbi:MAG: FeoB-associated Cys-rich membrane protein [Acidobacteria bacterium]|nr:FeoB-associated Cys-rich membrane protein [Acidobacteriota bacterium]MBA3784308.1 FeoB-associated Cys-rich membrane protein [Acidobacteriota bacterium]MBA4123227.1 FeoB-associated Cys-rich membrane protein [Acidobacteriota bacterium]MBA4185218.1 FeoB-associated Cys-rich membrane protein [Acidobacteriota bacterium]
MDWQTITVGIIVLLALLYVGANVRRKVKSFSSNSACGADCGCEGKRKNKIAQV